MIENTLRWWIVSERGWRLGGRSGEIRQTLDDSAGRRAKDLTAGLRIWPSPIELGRSRCRSSDVLGGCHGLKRARHDVRRARAVHIIRRLGFQQFGVGEDNPELIVQPVEEETQFRRFVHWSPRQEFLNADRLWHQA